MFRDGLVGAPLVRLHGIPAAPRTCEGWARRPRAKVPACDTPDTGRVALDWALEDRLGGESMDGRLASIEVCKGLDPGFVRAVRAELAPAECGDALAMPILAKPPVGLTGPIFHTLYGYAVAARAARVGAMTTHGQAELLSGLEAATAELPRSYGRAMALAGVAAAWTQLSLPDTSHVDRASRVAVEAMGAEGIGDAYSLEPARNWLTVPFGWLAEIDALQLPADEPGGTRAPPPPQPPSLGKMPCRDCYDDRPRAFSLVERLAEDLPSFLAAYVLHDDELASVEALRGFAGRGTLPARVRSAFDRASPSIEARREAARARLSLGLQFFDRREVDRAVAGYVASTPIRFEGWPRVRVLGGTWFTPHNGMTRVGTVNRTGSVNRELRRLSHRFERCFTAADASHPKVPGDVGLRFLISRAGSVFGAVAAADAPEGAALAECIAGVSRGLSFRQPEMGVWAVDVRFRAK